MRDGLLPHTSLPVLMFMVCCVPVQSGTSALDWTGTSGSGV